MVQNQQAYDDNLRGVLFNNKEKKELANKQDTEKWPDYKGSCEIEGVQYWVSGWIKTAKKSGDKFMSLSFTEKEDNSGIRDKARGPKTSSKQQATPDDDGDDDSVPF